MKIILGAAALIAAASVQAQPLFDYPTKTVSYGDLDLHSRAGMATLAQRIRLAAAAVCGARNGNVDLELRMETGACIRLATQQAMKAAEARTELADASH